MFILRIQTLIGGLAVACAMANPDLQMKYTFSGNLLSIPTLNINRHIDRLQELGRGILSPILGLAKSYNASISTRNKNTLQDISESSIKKVTIEDSVIYFPTVSTLEDNFPEATTGTDTTTDVWTTTEDYDEDIAIRLSAPPQAIASLLG